MAKITKTYITTDDTNKTYLMDPAAGASNPKLYRIDVGFNYVEPNGYSKPVPRNIKEFYVERNTLERLGMLPFIPKREPENKPTIDEVRETLEHLLSLVGIYPQI